MELREHFLGILEYPEDYIRDKKLSKLDLKKIFAYAESIIKDVETKIIYPAISEPANKYPNEYLPDRKYEFWAERISTYQQASKVMKIINDFVVIKERVKKQYGDKYYAWYHAFLQALGKEPQFPVNFSKKEIIDFGKKRYNTKGDGFYRHLYRLDLSKPVTFVSRMSPKDKSQWKKIIIDISNRDVDIVKYLKKFPN